ncbi:MAG TPA: beta-N-acetylhexosaminidase [Xanthobacteraceae bacterium]|nr:beta-N-acetylhexosaminidase [Xanthobacteraceae bacterium]
MPVKAFISGCASLTLSEEEKRFFSESCPWGLILFKRNIQDREQVSGLVQRFREIVGRADAPILIDQEGGRVQRLGPPNWPSFPAAERLTTTSDTVAAVALGARLIASELAPLGINVDCLPVADLRFPGAHDVIGDRAYGSDPKVVAELARAAAEGLLEGGVLPVVKHIPGHGRAMADSHLELPHVSAPRAELECLDFEPFRQLSDMPLAMTAHVIYEDIDPALPATLSPKVIAEVIRGYIGFDGCLMTDDVSMKALSGDIGANTAAAFEAGCDLALHCNGNLLEMRAVAENSPLLGGKPAERAKKALDRIAGGPKPLAVAEAWKRFSAMVETV